MIIYSIYIEDSDLGEVEGMINDKGEVIGYWWSNDASWRNEYFGPFMQKLGITVVTPEKKLYVKLQKVLKKHIQASQG